MALTSEVKKSGPVPTAKTDPGKSEDEAKSSVMTATIRTKDTNGDSTPEKSTESSPVPPAKEDKPEGEVKSQGGTAKSCAKDTNGDSVQQKDTESNTKASNSDVKKAGIAFWTKHTKHVLETMLEAVDIYTPEQQKSHVQFLEDYMIPAMGPAFEKSRARSLLSLNGSPFEISINHSDKGKSYVRCGIEPVFPGTQKSEGVTEDPIPAMAKKVGADLRWYNQFMEVFSPSEEDDKVLRSIMPPDTVRAPKNYVAFDFEEEKRTMKAYFYPYIKYMTSKLNADTATFDLIRRLDPLGPSFGPALDVIEEYQKGLFEDPPMLRMVAIDCSRPEDGARVKIYMEPGINTWAKVVHHVTLGGRLKDETTLEGLKILRELWPLMIDVPEDTEITDDFAKEVVKTIPKTSGLCLSWELKPGSPLPETKIYVPPPWYFKSNKASVSGIEKLFAKRGWKWGAEGAYKKIMSDAIGKDILDENIQTPFVSTGLSYNYSKKKGVYMTTYVAPFIRW